MAALAASALATATRAGENHGGFALADGCIAQATNGAVTRFRGVEMLESGRQRIAYFRCIRSGVHHRSSPSAFAGWVPAISVPFGGGAVSFSGVSI
jgi:hypothetical protein